jgi:protein gp37
MAEETGISWTDATFNPWWGCWPVSPGCALCYAARDAERYGWKDGGGSGPDLWKKTGERRVFKEGHWFGKNSPRAWAKTLPAQLRRRPRVFCASMADIGEDHPVAEQERPKLWKLIEDTPELDWLLLTKRTAKPWGWLPDSWNDGFWPRNVWLGFSAENQESYDRRIADLSCVSASVLFVSYEPALGPIDFRLSEHPEVSWIIAGGESALPAAKARPAHPDWFRSARDQCAAAGVPFHFKQWGEWLGGRFDHRKSKMVCLPGCSSDHPEFGRIFWTNPGEPPVKLWDEADHYWTNASACLGRKAAGRLLDGRTWDEFPASLGDPPARLGLDLQEASCGRL